MQWFHALTVGKRLSLLIATALSGLLAVAVLGLAEIKRVYEAASYAAANTVPSLVVLDHATDAFSDIRVLGYQHLVSAEAEEMRAIEAKINDDRLKVASALKEYEPLLSDDTDKGLLEANRARIAEFAAVQQQVLTLSSENKKVEATALAKAQMFAAAKAATAALMEHRLYNLQLGNDGKARAAALIKGADKVFVGVSLATLLVVATLGVLLTRHLLRQLGGEPAIAAAATAQVAAGRLDIVLAVKRGDRTSLMYSLETMRQALLQIVSDVRLRAGNMRTGTQQIRQGSDNLSQRTQEQASALEETASSMEEMSATVQQNADNARRTNELTADVRRDAERGGVVVQRAIAAMHEINASSKKMSEIIGVSRFRRICSP